MVLCLIALPLFAILGIFSLKYRKLAKDSLECIFKTATLRKCESGLDDRIRAGITGRLLKHFPKAAKLLYNNYKIFSWVMLALFVWSIYGSSVGIYNYVEYGNCNGPADTGFCLLDPTGQNNGLSEVDNEQKEIIYPVLQDDDPIIGNPNAELTIIEFGCYACPFTKKAEPIVDEVLAYYGGKVNLQFKTFVIPHHLYTYPAAMAANCAKDQGMYLQYHKALFDNQENLTNATMFQLAQNLNLDMENFTECFDSEKYHDEILDDNDMGLHAGVKGTPTFFINKQEIVGPKPFKTFRNIIDKELKR